MRRAATALAAAALVAGAACLGCAPHGAAVSDEDALRAAYPLNNPMHSENAAMTCASCHDEEDPTQGVQAVSNDKCLSCHESYDKVAERTAGIGEDLNPHNSFHYDQQLDCTTCHKAHSESVNLCMSCHDADQWMNDAP
ncbi:cytochrome c3 family protein [Gordonibacter sp. An230]|uniref:cytochrome c3 family protein n=1 Tax=Gordonibacter sp. An230 TaxID=1965592 RepID=UPI0013A63367|nr:cytochrome c3 family protein [Gordonibacter sp. An230]